MKNEIPYDMFDKILTEKEKKSALTLENVYHKGQDKIWNGKAVLASLIEKHNGIHLEPEKISAIKNIFNLILWGEFSAWRVSAQLSDQIENVEAKLAATSQTHDESRHFIVINSYLQELKYNPGKVSDKTSVVIEEVIKTNSLAKKLLGMQLMIEPIALTIFQLTRESKVEPVLCDLLSYIEVDEARHVALGINYLPFLIKEMSHPEKLDLLFWQLRMLFAEVQALKELEKDFEALGFTSGQVFKLAEKKQLEVLNMLADELGMPQKIWEPIRRAVELYKDYIFNNKEINVLDLAATTIYIKINKIFYPND